MSELPADWAIDRGSPVAVFEQIAGRIASLIDSGQLAVGDRLPPERDLASRIGVSRMTVRAALDALGRRGLLQRDVGRGTFVAPPKLEHELGPLAGFTEMLRREGLRARAEVRAVDELVAPTAVARELGLAAGTDVAPATAFRVERLRLAGAEPLALEESWLPAADFPGLAERDLGGSLYALMREAFHRPPVRAVQRLEPVAAEPLVADALAIAVGAPLMLVTRVALAADGRAVEFARDLHRGDRARFVVQTSAG